MRHRLALAALLCACSSQRARRPTAPAAGRVVVSLVGTSDLHGRVAMLPWLAGHVANLRRARAHDGAVLLVDAGDLFQGTIESNLHEGAAVVQAYNAMGYAAAAVGNHEFDYGPEGEAVFARAPGDDPRGALRARMREARFPWLTANIVDAATREVPAWENLRASALVDAGGVRVGLIGVSTELTPSTTLAVNFRGLAMRPLAESIRARAAALRADGAVAVVVLAHAGGACRRFDDPADLGSCESGEEIFEVARALPAGTVDAIVAGHTHQAIAHLVNGTPVIESYANGRAFGRVDLVVDRGARRVVDRRVFPPHGVCGAPQRADPDPEACVTVPYEGAPVVADAEVAALLAPALAEARVLRERPVGVTVTAPVRNAWRDESALNNLVADLLRASAAADVALMNAGGVRADLAPGPLDYGHLYAVLPFDNRLVTVRMRGGALREVLADNARGDGGTLAVSGVRVAATCEGRSLRVQVTRDDGRPVGDDEVLTVATNDYLAGAALARAALEALSPDAIVASPLLRDAVATRLAAMGTLRGDDPRWLDRTHPRMAWPGERPVRCR